jgi:hypothetical protein
MRVIPVAGNIIIKRLPVLDADGWEMDDAISTYRRWEIAALWDKVEIPVKVGDIVMMNRGNFFLILDDEKSLCHYSAIFGIESVE